VGHGAGGGHRCGVCFGRRQEIAVLTWSFAEARHESGALFEALAARGLQLARRQDVGWSLRHLAMLVRAYASANCLATRTCRDFLTAAADIADAYMVNPVHLQPQVWFEAQEQLVGLLGVTSIIFTTAWAWKV
jgi:hypothetical protein